MLFVRQISAISAPKETTSVKIPVITVISSKSLISSPPFYNEERPNLADYLNNIIN